jgi:hypothetical protein
MPAGTSCAALYSPSTAPFGVCLRGSRGCVCVWFSTGVQPRCWGCRHTSRVTPDTLGDSEPESRTRRDLKGLGVGT